MRRLFDWFRSLPVRDRLVLSAGTLWAIALLSRVAALDARGIGVFAILDDRTGALALIVLAAVTGFVLGTWRWPAVVGLAWGVLVAGSEAWQVLRLSDADLQARWRRFVPRWYEVDGGEIVALALFGLAGFALAAAAGTLLRRPLGRGEGLTRWRPLLVAVVTVAGWTAYADVLPIATGLGLIAVAAATFRPRWASCSLVAAFAAGSIGHETWCIVDGGLGPYWRASMDGFLTSSLAGELVLILLLTLVFALPAVLVGTFVPWLVVKLSQPPRRNAGETKPGAIAAARGTPSGQSDGTASAAGSP